MAAILEAIVALLAALVEAIGSLIAAMLQFGVLATLALPFVVMAELVVWLLQAVAELLSALFRWRKPKKVARPIFWRPKKRRSKRPEER